MKTPYVRSNLPRTTASLSARLTAFHPRLSVSRCHHGPMRPSSTTTHTYDYYSVPVRTKCQGFATCNLQPAACSSRPLPYTNTSIHHRTVVIPKDINNRPNSKSQHTPVLPIRCQSGASPDSLSADLGPSPPGTLATSPAASLSRPAAYIRERFAMPIRYGASKTASAGPLGSSEPSTTPGHDDTISRRVCHLRLIHGLGKLPCVRYGEIGPRTQLERPRLASWADYT